MVTLSGLTLTSYDLSFVQIAWKIATTSENLGNYSLDIYRSENPGVSGLLDYILIASGITISDYDHKDYSVSGLANFNRTWFYKFIVKNSVTFVSVIQPDTPVFIKNTPINHVAREILYKKNLSLNRKSGTLFYLVKKRDNGTRCTRCWDDILFRSKDGNCNLCYGTGFLSGYYKPIPFYGTATSAPKYNQVMMFGEWKPSDKLLYTTMYPPITTRDFIIDDTNKRWIALQIRPIQQLGVTVEQNVQMSLILPDDIIYKIIP